MPNTAAARDAAPKQPKPQLAFVWQDWLPYLEDWQASDAEKRALIEALWSIVVGFVDLGWEINKAAQESCGQTLDLKGALEAAVLCSKDTNTTREEA